MVSNGDAPKDRGIGVDGDVVLDNGMARNVEHVAVLVVLEALGTKGDTLIEGDVVADDARLANDDTSAMVDGEVFANLGAWVDVDTGFRVCLLGDDTGNDGYLQLVQLMGDAVMCHRVDHWVAEDDLAIVRRSGVVVEHGLGIP